MTDEQEPPIPEIKHISWEGYLGRVVCPACEFTMFLYEKMTWDPVVEAEEHFKEMHPGQDANYPLAWYFDNED